MRKLCSLLLLLTATMMAWTGAYAQTDAEYGAALAAIQENGVYYVKSDVGGTYYYLKGDGTLTATQADAAKFIFQKFASNGGLKEFGFKLNNNGTFFSNPPGTSEANLACGHINTSTRTTDPQFEAQVFFLNTDLGKYAVRAGNVPEATSGWSWVAGSYWTIVGDVDPVAQYQWAADYRWELEIDATATQQYGASLTVKSWPFFMQSAVGLVKDFNKYTSNAKQTSEGTYEALLDNEYTTFFHSCWSNGPDADHYLQAELSQATQKFEFYFKKRSQNNNNRPTVIVISASNDGTTFTDITTLDSGFPTEEAVIDYLSGVIDLGAAYKYVRFTITDTNNGAENNGHKFFTFSEFYILPGVDAAAQVAVAYNQLASLPWQSLTPAMVSQINTYDTALKAAISTVNVTYELYEADGTTLVKSQTVVQQPGTEVVVPNSLISDTKFYDYSVTDTNVGMTDCTIKIVRTLKPGFVGKLADLSNYKAYSITCDRGKFLTKDGYLSSTAHSSLTSAEAGQFAIISYEGNYYLYSVADGKFVKNNGELADNPANKLEDAIVMELKSVPYFLWHFNATDHVINTNGNDPYGYVINDYSTPDAGNQYYMFEEADFDPTNAIAALDALFHPAYATIYVVKDTNGNTIFTSDPEPAELGDVITTLPEKYRRAYYTYDDVNVTIETAGGTEAVFTATWGGPFEISTDFASAHWYDMAMRGTWYVTSAVKDGDGAYKTQNANTMGLVEDSYQWAFLGDGYNGFKIINKAEGEGKSFGWTDANATNAGIPTILDDAEGNHGWKIVPSTNTSVPAGSFCLNVPGTNLYINQYGGAGGSVKFWNSANNIGDGGSAFTVFDVPTNFSSFVNDEGIADAFETTGYFAFTDAAKAALGWNPAYKTDCPFEAYKSLKENLAAAMSDINNFVLPETGVYFLKNKNYSTLMGMDPSDANMYGNYAKIKDARNYVTLIKSGATYKISMMGKYAPATVAQSAQVTASTEAGTYTVTIPVVGYAAFQADPANNMSALHCASGGSIVGWEPAAAASQWAVEDATSINLTVGEAGYATAYLPFPVEIGKTLAIPAAKGAWTFDDGTTGSLTATAGVTIADGVATVPVGDYLQATHGFTNSGTYTIMMDVKILNEDNGRFTSLFMNGLGYDDGGLFFNNHKTNGRQIGINIGNMKYGGSYELDTWYRVVFSCQDSIPTVYVNGEKVVAATFNPVTTDAKNYHWGLSDAIYFFADNDGEENKVQADQIRLWDVALTADEVAMLGAYGDPEPTSSSVAAYTAVIKDGAEGKTPGDYKYLELNPLTDAIPALTAVVLKGDPAVYEFAIPAIAAEVMPDGSLKIYEDEVDGSEALVKQLANDEENVLKGTLEPISAVDKYVLAKPEGEDIAFYRAESGTLAAGKAYIEYDVANNIKAFYFAGEDPTGIANVEKVQVENGTIYNVAGQRLQKMQKGINIVNGKKILF